MRIIRTRRIDVEANSINRQRLCKGKVAALFIDGPHLVHTQRRSKFAQKMTALFFCP